LTRYLSLPEVVAAHNIMMRQLDYRPAPLGNEGRLESAINRAEMAAHYEGADLARQAALTAVGISQAQAFLDGNKRTGFTAMDLFLRVNGVYFSGDSLEFARQLERVAERSGELDAATEDFEAWLRDNVSPL
jgi:death-on-curing protein